MSSTLPKWAWVACVTLSVGIISGLVANWSSLFPPRVSAIAGQIVRPARSDQLDWLEESRQVVRDAINDLDPRFRGDGPPTDEELEALVANWRSWGGAIALAEHRGVLVVIIDQLRKDLGELESGWVSVGQYPNSVAWVRWRDGARIGDPCDYHLELSWSEILSPGLQPGESWVEAVRSKLLAEWKAESPRAGRVILETP